MTRATNRPSLPGWGSVKLFAVAGLVTFMLMVIVLLSIDVRTRLAALERTDNGNGQWVMMQTEVEVLRFQNTINKAMDGEASPEEVRRWFNVVYSRLALLRDGPRFREWIRDPESRAKLESMQAYVDHWLPVIDASDDDLRAALPKMEAQSNNLQRLSRSLSLSSVRINSANADENRARISDTFLRLAMATTATFILLAVLAAMATRLYRTTQRQAVENQNTTARLKMIIETSPDAIIVTTRDAQVVEFNSAAETMFGLDRNRALGTSIMSNIFAPDLHPSDQIAFNDRIKKAASHGPQRFELTGRRADGSAFPLEISLAISDRNAGPLIVAFLRDVSRRHSDRLALEQALTRAQAGEKAKADFMTVMSHEMRTPLNGLIGSMDLLRETPLDENQSELLRIMQVSGGILLRHVESVLDIARAEAGTIRLADTTFELDRLIEDCIANQAGVARAGSNSIRHVALSGPLGTVRGDPGRLQQILLNLIGNSVKFTRNGSITIETERLPQGGDPHASHMVEFRVVDTGIGIPEAHLDRVFDDFATVDSSFGRDTGGTGLGLGIARRIVHAMGGTIGVESEAGEGSVFWLQVPLEPAPPLSDPSSLSGPGEPQSQSETTPLKILVIEDNDINRYLLRRYLSDSHHILTETCDGLDGVAAAKATRFDVIITDVAMPRLDGLAATRRIRAGGASSGARIIALTAHALPEDIDRMYQAGMDVCLTKPITRSALLREIRATPDRPEIARPDPLVISDSMAPPLKELSETIGFSAAESLTRRMIAEGDASIAKLTSQSIAEADFRRIAHQFAGSCATVGAMPLHKALITLEFALQKNDTATHRRILADLPQLWQDTRQVLASFSRSGGG